MANSPPMFSPIDAKSSIVGVFIPRITELIVISFCQVSGFDSDNKIGDQIEIRKLSLIISIDLPE